MVRSVGEGPSSDLASPGQVIDTLDLLNGTVISGNFVTANGLSPTEVAYDSRNGYLYVTEYGSAVRNPAENNVTVINGATDTVVATIPVDGGPDEVAFDSWNGYVYVSDAGPYDSTSGSNVTVINGATDAVIGNIPMSGSPNGLAFDSANGEVYVANSCGGPYNYRCIGNVTVIDGATDKVVENVYGGDQPSGVAFDSSNGKVFVSTYYNTIVINGTTDQIVGSIPGFEEDIAFDSSNGNVYEIGYGDDVTIINGTTDAVVGSVPVGPFTAGIAFDPANGYVYVAISGKSTSSYPPPPSNVTVINGATNTAIGSVPVGPDPEGIAFDGSNGYLYVANAAWSNVSVIDGATDSDIGSVAVTASPQALAFDNLNGDLYVTGSANGLGHGRATVINATTDRIVGSIQVGAIPNGIALDVSNGLLFVTNYNSNSVTVINGTTDRVFKTIYPGGGEYDIVFDSSNGDLYATNGPAGNVTVINGTTASIIGYIAYGIYPSGIAFDKTNGDLYVSMYGSPYVSVINGATNAVIKDIPMAGGTSGVAVDSSNGYVYVANTGNVTVINGATNNVIQSIPVLGGPGSVVFDGSNGYLYVTTRDGVAVINGATDQVLGSVPLATSTFGGDLEDEALDTSNGDLYITNFEAGSVAILDPNAPSCSSCYSAVFRETGLPTGTDWGITVDGVPEMSSTTWIGFQLANGTNYSFSVEGVPGLTATPSSGTFDVTGGPISEAITFTSPQTTYKITVQTVSSTGRDIAGATVAYVLGGKMVTVGDPTTLAGYTSAYLVYGTYALIANATGFYNAAGTVTVRGGPPAALVIVMGPSSKAPPPTYKLTVEVATISDVGIPGAWANYTVSSGARACGDPTSSAGYTSCYLSIGIYPFTLAARGYQTGSGDIAVGGTTVAPTVELPLAPLYKLTIQVTTTGNAGIQGAWANRTMGGVSTACGDPTMSAGYTSCFLANGTYAFTVSAKGYDTESLQITVDGTTVAPTVKMVAD